MTDNEYDKLAERYAKAYTKDMNRTVDNLCNKAEGYKDLTPAEQEFIKRVVLLNVGEHFGGFNKKVDT